MDKDKYTETSVSSEDYAYPTMSRFDVGESSASTTEITKDKSPETAVVDEAKPISFGNDDHEKTPVFEQDLPASAEEAKPLSFDKGTEVKVDVVEATSQINPVTSAVDKVAFNAATAVNTVQHVAGVAKEKVDAAKEKTVTFATAVAGATAEFVGLEQKPKPVRVRTKDQIDAAFARENSNNIVLPVRYYQPTTVDASAIESAIPLKLRHRAACIVWLMAASKLPRMHQSERYMFSVVATLSRLKYTKDNDVFALRQTSTTDATTLMETALQEIQLNLDPQVLMRVYNLLKPLLSDEDTQMLLTGEWTRHKPAYVFEQEKFIAVSPDIARQRFVSIIGRTKVDNVTFSSSVTRKEILANKHIAPEDALACLSMYGMLSLCDLVMLLTMTSTAIRRDSSTLDDAYKLFDLELGDLYLKGAQGGVKTLVELSKAVTPASGPKAYEFCQYINDPQGLLYGLLMFLGRRKLINKVFYYFLRA